MNRDARFWDKRAEKYSQRPVGDQATYEKKLEITRSYFRPDSEVLEMGCGTGSTALSHAPLVKHILATDISPGMIDIAKGKRSEASKGQVSPAITSAWAYRSRRLPPHFSELRE